MSDIGNIAKNFEANEFKCRCGCGFCSPSAKLVVTLQTIRDKVNTPLSISSGCRCTLHNKNSGSTVNGPASNLKKGNPGTIDASAHTRGEAADIKVTNITKAKLYDLICAMHKNGELPFLTYTYKVASGNSVVHVGVDDFKKRLTPYGGNG